MREDTANQPVNLTRGMANRYYREGEGRAEGVQDLFAAVAPRYDLINDLQSFGLHRLWKRRLVRLADVQAGDTALDVCCGTGDIAFALAGAGARVTGVDFSEAMLTRARARAKRESGDVGVPARPVDERVGYPSAREGRDVAFRQADALALPFDDRSFDLVTVGYGLRNLKDLDAGLREMARVCRPGGRLLVLDFGKPSNLLWRSLYFLHLRTVVPLLGRLFCGDADTHRYILESLRRYPEAPAIAGRMEQAGWTQVRWWNLLGGVMTIHRGVAASA